MAKIKVETQLAREFLQAFPSQAQFGVAGTARHMKALLDAGMEPGALLARILTWSRARSDLKPWELVKEPAGRPIPPVQQAPRTREIIPLPVPDRVARRIASILHPIERELEDC